MAPKRTARRDDGAGNALARRAREAERALRASLKGKAGLPQEEVRETRREREARLIYQALHGNEEAQDNAAKMLQGARAEAADRERLRAHRQRRNKHLPSGLVPIPHDDGGTAFVLRSDHQDYVLASRQLAADAQVLRALFERVVAYDSPTLKDHARDHDRTQVPPCYVRPEVAKAIHAAMSEVSHVWITLLVELVTDAVIDETHRGRRLKPWPHARPLPHPVGSAREIHAALKKEMSALGLPLPGDIDEAAVAWVRSHLAVGVLRGGGKSSRLAVPQMRALLADPKRLAAAMAKSTRRRPNS